MSTPEAVLAYNASPQPDLSRIVRHSVAALAHARNVDEEDLANFLVALGEALANAIEHAKANTPVHVEIAFDDASLTATIVDRGNGFVVRGGGDALPSDASERGRGIPIMRRCCDEFRIASEPGNGTAVVLRRYLRPPAADVA